MASTEEDQSPQVAELENARRRFRSVLSLNILLSTIIRGHATLEWETDPPNDNQIEKPEYSLLKYVAAILVRDIDVIAAMAHKTKASLSSTDVSSTPAPYQVNVMCVVNQPPGQVKPIRARLSARPLPLLLTQQSPEDKQQIPTFARSLPLSTAWYSLASPATSRSGRRNY